MEYLSEILLVVLIVGMLINARMFQKSARTTSEQPATQIASVIERIAALEAEFPALKRMVTEAVEDAERHYKKVAQRDYRARKKKEESMEEDEETLSPEELAALQGAMAAQAAPQPVEAVTNGNAPYVPPSRIKR